MQTEITIAIYFALVLILGLLSALKIKTPGDYFIAGKKAGHIQITGSLLATILGGSAILGTIELSGKTGWAALWFIFSAAAGMAALIPLTKRIKHFGNFTLPEMIGRFYGHKAELISSVIIPAAWLGIIAAQIIAAAKIISALGYTGYTEAAIISGAVFIAYTILGGQMSILKTDALQALLIVAGLTAIIIFSVQDSSPGKYTEFKFSLLFNSSFTPFDLLILLLTYSVTFVTGPDIYSRLFCAKNQKTARHSVIAVALILIPVSFALTYIGIVSHAAGNGIVGYAGSLLPGWAFGLFIAALLSAVMSSADTTLLTSSMIVNELFTGTLKTKNSINKTRIIILFTGTASIIIALFITSVIQALLLALAFFSGAFVVPVIAGLLNLKVNRNMVVWAILAGGITALAGKLVHNYYNETTGNIMIIVSYICNGGLLFFRRSR